MYIHQHVKNWFLLNVLLVRVCINTTWACTCSHTIDFTVTLMRNIDPIFCQEIKVMCTTEMVQLGKEFVTKLDDKLDLKDPYGERLITLFPQAVL